MSLRCNDSNSKASRLIKMIINDCLFDHAVNSSSHYQEYNYANESWTPTVCNSSRHKRFDLSSLFNNLFRRGIHFTINLVNEPILNLEFLVNDLGNVAQGFQACT